MKTFYNRWAQGYCRAARAIRLLILAAFVTPFGFFNAYGDVDLSPLVSGAVESWEEVNPCAIAESCASTGKRRLLRFHGRIINYGDSDLLIGDPLNPQIPGLNIEFDACHNHFHVVNVARYELARNPDNVVVTSRKIGFCLLDYEPWVVGAPPPQFHCGNQGITRGWSDVYDRSLDCQWLDITGVPAGLYKLRMTVNPDGILPDANPVNNMHEIDVQVPDVSVPALSKGGLAILALLLAGTAVWMFRRKMAAIKNS